MKLLKKAVLTVASVGTLGISSLSAHSLWINSFESFSHAPGHTTVGLGWGHSIPVDDILNSPNGKVIIDKFNITSPDGKITNLRIPTSKVKDPTKTTENFDIFGADVGLQKVALKKDSKKGVYKIEAVSKPTVYTQYIDTKDRTRLKLTTMDKIKDIKKTLMSVKYQAFAKSYLTLDKWSEQKATNKGLEIIPKTDLSNIKVGDLVKFEVLFYGKPLSVSAKSMEFITAMSNGFGQNEGFALVSFLKEGKAQFRVQTPGQWIVSCNHKDTVTKDSELKDLVGKVNAVFNGASLTFNVKE